VFNCLFNNAEHMILKFQWQGKLASREHEFNL